MTSRMTAGGDISSAVLNTETPSQVYSLIARYMPLPSLGFHQNAPLRFDFSCLVNLLKKLRRLGAGGQKSTVIGGTL